MAKNELNELHEMMDAFEPAATKMVKQLLAADMAASPHVVSYSQGVHRGLIHALADGLCFAKALNDVSQKRMAALEARIIELEGSGPGDDRAMLAIEGR